MIVPSDNVKKPWRSFRTTTSNWNMRKAHWENAWNNWQKANWSMICCKRRPPVPNESPICSVGKSCSRCWTAFLVASGPTMDGSSSNLRQVSSTYPTDGMFGSVANEKEVCLPDSIRDQIDMSSLSLSRSSIGWSSAKHRSFVERWTVAPENESELRRISETAISAQREENERDRWYLQGLHPAPECMLRRKKAFVPFSHSV